MIELITGAPGSGKSFYSVKLVVQFLLEGKVVATNVPLVPDFAERLSKRGKYRWKSPEKQLARQRQFERNLFTAEYLHELLKVRVRKPEGVPDHKAEGSAEMVVDEAHRELNNRMWDNAVGRSKDEAIKDRLDTVKFFTAHRHYLFNIRLITQDENNIDRQVRSLFEYVTRLRNLKNVSVLGFKVFWLNIFVAIKFWNDTVKTKCGVNTFLMDKGVADLYYTHALKALDMPDDAILLPRELPGDGPGGDGAGGGGRSPSLPVAGPSCSLPVDGLVSGPLVDEPGERLGRLPWVV